MLVAPTTCHCLHICCTRSLPSPLHVLACCSHQHTSIMSTTIHNSTINLTSNNKGRNILYIVKDIVKLPLLRPVIQPDGHFVHLVICLFKSDRHFMHPVIRLLKIEACQLGYFCLLLALPHVSAWKQRREKRERGVVGIRKRGGGGATTEVLKKKGKVR